MKDSPASSIGPLAIAMDVEFIDRLGEPVRAGKAKNISTIIRTALEQYDFDEVMFLKPAQVSISVRLPVEVRKNLRKVARTKHTSVGQLVRAAVEAYLPRLEAQSAAVTKVAGRKRTRRKPRGLAKPRGARGRAERSR